MILTAFNTNLQYQKTEVEYEMTISKVANEGKAKELEANTSDINAVNLPMVYMNESDLTNSELLRKMLLENIMSSFSSEKSAVSLYPNAQTSSYDSNKVDNPYKQNNPALPQGFLYESSSEYYEKTTIDFNAEMTIKTPEGEYKVEVKFSYTHEFYEKNETQIAVMNDQLKNRFEVELPEDDPSLKNLKSLHFVFEMIKQDDKENKKQIFEEIKAALKERSLDAKNDAKEEKKELQHAPIDNYQIWLSQNESEYNLVTAQKDGIGLFLANAKEESSYLNFKANENGYSLETGYSYSQSSVSGSFEEVKA